MLWNDLTMIKRFSAVLKSFANVTYSLDDFATTLRLRMFFLASYLLLSKPLRFLVVQLNDALIILKLLKNLFFEKHFLRLLVHLIESHDYSYAMK